jgi:pimeloyl-ACP methyl ester carboxylesterase
MQKILHLCWLVLVSTGLSAQYQGPIPPITSGYGSDGPNAVAVSMLVNDHWIGNKIAVYYPVGTATPVPTLFYSHGFGANDTTFNRETLRHIASKGYAVVFVPYRTLGADVPERYATLHDGFNKAARTFTSIIDTTRAAFAGHSFGGGATPRMAYQAYADQGWGANGKFIYCSAPWYSFELGTDNLSNFPASCNLLTVLYDDDDVNDHRMGMDIFNHIAIGNLRKDCIMVYSDTISGYSYISDHTLPGQYNSNGEFDALDYYVTARLLDALFAYTFTGDLTAQNIALGDGSVAQVDMGPLLSPLVVTNSPVPVYPQSRYEFPCDTVANERVLLCQDLSLSIPQESAEIEIGIYPNPSAGKIVLDLANIAENATVRVHNLAGVLVFSAGRQAIIDLSGEPDGVYVISVDSGSRTAKEKVILLK